MVYESDFYTTRRPYRPSPSVSSYTVSYYYPSRQVRILPGIGRVHVVHSYDRIIPYVGHKRLTVVPTTGHVYRVRPSVIVRELSRIQHKVRPYVYFSPTSHYLNSETARMFDDESRYIRAQSAALLKRLQYPVPRVQRSWPITTVSRYEPPTSLRITPVDEYINRMLAPIKNVKQDIYNISHYYTTDLNRKYIGRGHLSCVSYAGDKAYDRRRNYTVRDIYLRQNDTVRNDIQLLSYYIKNMRDKKAIEAASHPALSPTRPSRVFSQMKMLEDERADIKEMKEARAQRLAKIYAVDDTPKVDVEGARIKRATKQKEEERLAEERALEEEKAKKEEARKKEEAARKAELARQEALAAQAAAERAAELERKAAEQARKEEEAKKAEQARIEAEKKKKEEEKKVAELARQEEERKAELARQEEERKAELARQEEERQQLLRLEEIARQAEEEKEKELARQAEELAELARQEAELAEAARKEAELAELAKKEAELAELERQEKELAELDRKERELAEAAKQEAEMAEQQKEAEEIAVLSEATPAQVLSPEPVEEVAEPVVEEPVTPDVQDTADESKPTAEEVEEEEEEEEE